jgi:5-methyltetrahydropteroyltriglutamate--homocysteine methyltransferase
MYPATAIPGYSREEFIQDLLREHRDGDSPLPAKGAHAVQVDFTEGPFSMKIDPRGLLHSFIEVNNLALRFSPEARASASTPAREGDRDSTHSADVDYGDLLPSLFELKAGNFYVSLAGEMDRRRVLRIIRDYLKPAQRVFVGVIATIAPRAESPEEVRDLIREAAEYIPLHQLGTTDDCGFAPFADDTSTSRDLAFEKIRARIVGTRLASEVLGAT